MSTPAIGRVGIWSLELRFGDPVEAAEAAAEIDELGFGALWIPGGIDDAVLGSVDALLDVTSRITIATGIINIWKHKPQVVAAWFAGQSAQRQARLLLGLGISHGPMIGEAWQKPLAKTREFLDGLDSAGMPRDQLCLAALGPKMLALSGERTAGAHPYLVTPQHTATARDILGPGKLLAPEQGVILQDDPARARQAARSALAMYQALPNYRNNWLRLGFSQADVDSVSDALLDGLFAWGDLETIAGRVREHHDAGADHVCLQVIQGEGGNIAGLRAACRALAGELL
ncbi:LLM class F420-dependent oxidoreductase [Mangrovimicrobium sediminis]|uniref:LLM class F420-dependent oxidoreductase n=1 Tax=Mangrovimicrobium sediminis TaxID=2562682 RepID=A0A4Z0LXR5_9GAMM|nr:LLM class F420-dependent oxidoreductase [Haliea sp. SAOS-164]TGD72132.1 LLM class F420-dependent oxidoreductase [Haliea sp. SAOS-164]